MGLFSEYPYQNHSDLNLDYILRKIKELTGAMADFVNINSVKYADPILWSIATSYEYNTVVIDPNTGDGYISRKAVPSGVLLSNAVYWTVIFNYAASLPILRHQIAAADDGHSATATAARLAGSLIWLDSTLYRVTQPISAGSAYVIGTNIVQTTVEAEIKLYDTKGVNVRDFGAVGNADYYRISDRTWWSNIGMTVAPTSDVDAVNAAIAFALDNGITTVYFPKGNYYLPGWSYDLDISKLRFEGDGNSSLVSSGLSSGDYFIKLVGPISHKQYEYSRTTLDHITLYGSYNVGRTESGVTGLLWGTGANVLTCHDTVENLTIAYFNTGLQCGQSYKTTFKNLSVIACGLGIRLPSGSSVPIDFIGGFIECCGRALADSGTGWSFVKFSNFAFEYNMRQMNSGSHIIFEGCRFEFDPQTYDSWSFNISGPAVFDNCDFLMLPNFVANVGNWIDNPSQFRYPQVTASIFSFGTSGVIGTFMNCNMGIDNGITFGSGFYTIGSNGANVGVYNCTFTGNRTNLINTTSYASFRESF